MPTTVNDQLCDTVQNLKDSAQVALANSSADEFASFEKYLSEVEAYVREIHQSMWADEARATIRRLEKGEELNDTDRDVIRAFMIAACGGISSIVDPSNCDDAKVAMRAASAL